MTTEISPISPNNFLCNVCTISCKRKTEWLRHIQTKKHIFNKNGENSNGLATSESPFVCECGKIYTDRSGLWRHKKKCNNSNDADMKNLVLEVVKSNTELQKQNNEFKELLIEQNKTIIDAIKYNSITNNNHINSHNKTFNLQVFLNEDCKDAMNITDFVNSINLQLSDLEHVGEVGYVEGISNIIIKNLKALDVTKRPVHCTDPKRETIYIKDGGVWEKDEDDNKKLRKMIKSVAFRNSKNTRLFKEKHPDCNNGNSKYSDLYNKIVIEAMGGGSKCNDFDSENKIMRKIAKVMTIDKSTF